MDGCVSFGVGCFSLPFLTLYRPIHQLLEGSKLAFALKEQYLNHFKRYRHDRHTHLTHLVHNIPNDSAMAAISERWDKECEIWAREIVSSLPILALRR